MRQRPGDKTGGQADVTDDHAKQFARHLTFLGYRTSGPGEDGWWRATHPRRWSVHFLATPLGMRLHCSIHLGDRVALKELAWLQFVNRFNDDAIIARGALSRDAEGEGLLRARALLPPTYDRHAYGALLDAWHSDLEMLDRAPARDETAPVGASVETIN